MKPKCKLTALFMLAGVCYGLTTKLGGAAINGLGVETPLDAGQIVSGFQDDFTSATRDPGWRAIGPGGDKYLQEGGVLKVFANHGDPNHLVYSVPGQRYTNDVQEVLARIRIVAFGTGDFPRGGIGVAIGTNSQGINLHFRDSSQDGVSGRQFKLLDDTRAWGPPGLKIVWTTNTWYWLRLRQDHKMDGVNTVFGKVWSASGGAPEPNYWQMSWEDSALPT